MLLQRLAGERQLHAARMPLQQRHADGSFQIDDALARCTDRHPCQRRALADAAGSGNGAEQRQGNQVDAIQIHGGKRAGEARIATFAGQFGRNRRSEAYSPIIIAAQMLALGIVGMTAESATREPATPCTRNCGSTTAVGLERGCLQQLACQADAVDQHPAVVLVFEVVRLDERVRARVLFDLSRTWPRLCGRCCQTPAVMPGNLSSLPT